VQKYTPPPGGGGVTATITANGQRITFEHGARHLEHQGLNTNSVQQRIANEVSQLQLGVGQSHRGRVVVDGVTIEFRAYRVSSGTINVGTFYIPLL
jgi:hypothetical protein